MAANANNNQNPCFQEKLNALLAELDTQSKRITTACSRMEDVMALKQHLESSAQTLQKFLSDSARQTYKEKAEGDSYLGRCEYALSCVQKEITARNTAIIDGSFSMSMLKIQEELEKYKDNSGLSLQQKADLLTIIRGLRDLREGSDTIENNQDCALNNAWRKMNLAFEKINKTLNAMDRKEEAVTTGLGDIISIWNNAYVAAYGTPVNGLKLSLDLISANQPAIRQGLLDLHNQYSKDAQRVQSQHVTQLHDLERALTNTREDANQAAVIYQQKLYLLPYS